MKNDECYECEGQLKTDEEKASETCNPCKAAYDHDMYAAPDEDDC